VSLERFICVSVLPYELASILEPLRADLAAQSGAREAMAYPLHVTLRTGFQVPPENQAEFFEDFGSVIRGHPSFAMRTRGLSRVSYQEGRRFLIAYEVVPDSALLGLHGALLSYTSFMKGEQYKYSPHVTLAFHDLGPEGFALCSKWIDEHPMLLGASFEWDCDNVCLLSKAGDRWEERMRYPLA
jgi:2'-5' RNA ligase